MYGLVGSNLFLKPWYKTRFIVINAILSAVALLGLGVLAVKKWDQVASFLIYVITMIAGFALYFWSHFIGQHRRIRDELLKVQRLPEEDVKVSLAARQLSQGTYTTSAALTTILAILSLFLQR